MKDNGLTASTLQGAILAKLLDSLGVSKYLTEHGCSHDEYPYKDSVDGWSKGNLEKRSLTPHDTFYLPFKSI